MLFWKVDTLFHKYSIHDLVFSQTRDLVFFQTRESHIWLENIKSRDGILGRIHKTHKPCVKVDILINYKLIEKTGSHDAICFIQTRLFCHAKAKETIYESVKLKRAGCN